MSRPNVTMDNGIVKMTKAILTPSLTGTGHDASLVGELAFYDKQTKWIAKAKLGNHLSALKNKLHKCRRKFH